MKIATKEEIDKKFDEKLHKRLLFLSTIYHNSPEGSTIKNAAYREILSHLSELVAPKKNNKRERVLIQTAIHSREWVDALNKYQGGAALLKMRGSSSRILGVH